MEYEIKEQIKKDFLHMFKFITIFFSTIILSSIIVSSVLIIYMNIFGYNMVRGDVLIIMSSATLICSSIYTEKRLKLNKKSE